MFGPSIRTLRSRIISFQPDSPYSIVRARFNENSFTSAQKKVAQLGVLAKLGNIAFGHQAASVLFPHCVVHSQHIEHQSHASKNPGGSGPDPQRLPLLDTIPTRFGLVY